MKHYMILFYAGWLKYSRTPFMWSDATIKLLLVPGFNRIRIFNGKAMAYAEYVKARRRVPAYNDFLKSTGFTKPSFKGITPNIHEIPSTDKENYVKKYAMEERCIYGKIPEKGVIIDESSGSTGSAVNWVRGRKERKNNARLIRFGLRNSMGKEPLFIINAFALGAWATGINISMSCSEFSKLKSLGPDMQKIENTLKNFGQSYKYVILGYPPFLKSLVDGAAIAWQDYDISFIFGGESMSESMREYLISKGIKKVYSSFGASDLELNISAENDFTISLRKLIRDNPDLQNKILKHHQALPMVFQFNPVDFLFETDASGELVITICRPNYLAPKIRYNLHDVGHVLQMKELDRILKELNISKKQLAKPLTDLPILLHYGRADMTVAFFGSNISPIDIQETLYNMPFLVNSVNSFCIKTAEDNSGSKYLIVSLEMQKSHASFIDAKEVRSVFFEQLAAVNQDFREAKRMLPDESQLLIEVYEFGQGPFENADIRIKAKYLN